MWIQWKFTVHEEKTIQIIQTRDRSATHFGLNHQNKK